MEEYIEELKQKKLSAFKDNYAQMVSEYNVSLRLPASCSLIFSRLALPVKVGIYEKSGKETTTRENVLVYRTVATKQSSPTHFL